MHSFSIDRTAPAFVETSSRLRRLYPDYPRVYPVAAMAEQGKRRWVRLADAIESGRIDLMFRRSVTEMSSVDAAAEVVATALVHAVIGRVVAPVVLDARAWDPGLDNMWIHFDSDGGIDWAGVVDTTIRLLPTDPRAGEDGTVTLPCEAALAVWTAHRAVGALDAVLAKLSECASLDSHRFWGRRFWGIVGESVVGAATYVPVIACSSASDGMRRGQAVLDAIVAAGRPVRGARVA